MRTTESPRTNTWRSWRRRCSCWRADRVRSRPSAGGAGRAQGCCAQQGEPSNGPAGAQLQPLRPQAAPAPAGTARTRARRARALHAQQHRVLFLHIPQHQVKVFVKCQQRACAVQGLGAHRVRGADGGAPGPLAAAQRSTAACLPSGRLMCRHSSQLASRHASRPASAPSEVPRTPRAWRVTTRTRARSA